MKITQLFKIYWPDNGGGIAKVIESIADGLPEYEQQIIVCQDSKHKKCADDHYKGIAVRRCRQLFTVASTPVSVQFLREIKRQAKDTDIFIYHFPYPMVDLAIWFGFFSGKLVVWWHCGFEKNRKLAVLYKPLVRQTLKKADLILISARGNVKHSGLLKKYQNKCRVIPFCVSDTYLSKGKDYVEKPSVPPTKNKQISILFIGRLVWYKGCDVLLKAFSRMRNKNCRLVLVGSGPLEEPLKILAHSLNLKQVEFTGMVSEEEKVKQIEACDFLVLPSISDVEAFAIVQIEAMAFGKPVINTRLKSGVPEVGVDGITGKTVEPGNIRELAEAMDELATNAELRTMYGLQAQKRVQKEYTQEMMSKRYRHAFQKLLEKSEP